MKTAILTLLVSLCSFGQTVQPTLQCQPSLSVDGLVSYCEMRDLTAVSTGALDVEGNAGAVTVTGWDRPDILIHAQVTTAALDAWRAASLAAAVQVTETAGAVTSSGPAESSDQQWFVAYEIFVPYKTDLTINARFGAIAISEVSGTIRFSTHFGAVSLNALGGDVQGSSEMGAIAIVLEGDRWNGTGLNVQTHMGAIAIAMPAAYSAHLDLSTGMGVIQTPFGAGTGKKKLFGGSVSLDIGSGGAPLEASTKMGAITVSTH
jgi:hypothetical protein